MRRNLGHIESLVSAGVLLSELSKSLYRILLVVSEVFRQQQSMYDQSCHRINDRIVSLTQPQVRPIVQGKGGTPVEFGSKLSLNFSNTLLNPDSCCKVFLKRLDFPVSITKQVFRNKNQSTGILYLACSNLDLTATDINTIYQKRWKVEEFHKSLKSNLTLAKSPTGIAHAQKNHVSDFVSIRNSIILLSRLNSTSMLLELVSLFFKN
nr:transposase [Pseudanabaena sp. SR411]